jgi:hypothetical protein
MAQVSSLIFAYCQSKLIVHKRNLHLTVKGIGVLALRTI